MCLSGPKAYETYKIHGMARNCKDGKGGEWANDVYIFNGKNKFPTIARDKVDKILITAFRSTWSSYDIL